MNESSKNILKKYKLPKNLGQDFDEDDGSFLIRIFLHATFKF